MKKLTEDFKPGDIVELKSGGPPMTIEDSPDSWRVPHGYPIKSWRCSWFKGAKREEALFQIAALQRATTK